jgi:hypothetical protein
MRTHKLAALVTSAAMSVGFSAAIIGCADKPPASRPIMYGTDGNRGVTAPSRGLPQNTSSSLGGAVTSTPGQDRPDQTIVGASAGVDAVGTGTIGTGGGPATQPAGDVRTGTRQTPR